MARKRYSDEDVLKLLREIDVHLHDGLELLWEKKRKLVKLNKGGGVKTQSFEIWLYSVLTFLVEKVRCYHLKRALEEGGGSDLEN